jgi:hypothetical protein
VAVGGRLVSWKVEDDRVARARVAGRRGRKSEGARRIGSRSKGADDGKQLSIDELLVMLREKGTSHTALSTKLLVDPACACTFGAKCGVKAWRTDMNPGSLGSVLVFMYEYLARETYSVCLRPPCSSKTCSHLASSLCRAFEVVSGAVITSSSTFEIFVVPFELIFSPEWKATPMT